MPSHVKITSRPFPLTYTVTVAEDTFDFEGPFWTAADLTVTVDGDELALSDWSVVGNFIQDGDTVVGAYGGGTITLNAAVSNCEVVIDRLVVDTRDTDYSTTGPLPQNALNSDLDRLTARDQDLLAMIEAATGGGPVAKASQAIAVKSLDDIPDLDPHVDQDAIIVEAFSATAPIGPAIYIRADADPGHDLAAQDANGDWWVIDGSLGLNIQVAGLDEGGDIATVLPTLMLATSKVVIPALPFTLSQVDLNNADFELEGLPGHVITPAAASSALLGLQIKADGIILRGLNMRGIAGTSTSVTGDINRWLYCPRQGSTHPTRLLTRKRLKLIDCNIFGGTNGAILTNVEDFEIDRCVFEWAIGPGLSLSGAVVKGRIRKTRVRYNACQGTNGGGGLVIGQSEGAGATTIRDVGLDDCDIEWNGWYASGSPQSGLDCYANSVDGLYLEDSRIAHNGDCIEIKKASDPTSANHYRDVHITRSKLLQMMPVGTMIVARHHSDATSATAVTDVITDLQIEDNDYTSDPVSKVIVLGSNAIATASGTKTVTVNSTAHGAAEGEIIKILTVGAIGGVPAYELQIAREVHVVDGDNFSFQVETSATSTASGGSGASIYCQFRSPVTVTGSFTNTSNYITVNMTAHGASAGDAVDLSGFATTAGINASLINIRARIHDVPDVDSFKVWLPIPATSTPGSPVSGKARIRRNAGLTALSLISWQSASSSGNTYNGVPVCADFSGLTEGAGEPLTRPIFANEVFKNVGVAYQHHGGTVTNLKIVNPTGRCYQAFLTQINGVGPLSGEVVGGDIEVLTGYSSPTGFINALYLVNFTVRNVKAVVASVPVIIDSSGGEAGASDNVRFEGCDLVVDNPVSPGTGKSTMDATVFELRTGTNYRVFNNYASPSNAAKRSTTFGVSATGVGYNNRLGYTASIPVTAGALGDVFVCAPANATQELWQCTTAGASGVAVWTAR